MVDNILFDGGEQMNFAQDLDSLSSTLLRHIPGSSHTVVNYCPISVSASRLHSETGTKSHSPYHNCLAQGRYSRDVCWMMNKWRKEPIDALTDRANLSLKCLPPALSLAIYPVCPAPYPCSHRKQSGASAATTYLCRNIFDGKNGILVITAQ